jgi:hypothetical protein
MKPFERVLECDERGDVWETGKPGAWRHTMPAGHSCTAAEALEFGRLFAAATDMARALKEMFGTSEHLALCPALTRPGRSCHPDCMRARSALQKAGVPLP